VAVEDILQRARVLADLGRYDDTDRLLAQVLAEDPDNEDGLALHVRVLVARRRFDEAEAAARRLLREHPDSLRGLLHMARIPALLHRPRDGVPSARRAVELYPDNVTCLVALADVLRQVTHGSVEALALAQQAIAIDPEDADAYRLLGAIHLDLRQYGEAEHWTLRALRINPADPWTMIELGLARAGLGRFEESRDEVMAALRADPRAPIIKHVIAHVEARAIPGHFTEVYRMALAARGLPDLSYPGAAGNDPELIAAQGRLVRRMYTLEADRAGLRRAGELAAAVLAADPHNADARYVRSRELTQAGEYQQARALAEQLLAEGYPSADVALVVAHGGLSEFDAALAIVRRKLADNPDSPMYLRTEAGLLTRLKRYDEALRSARRAADLSPSAPEVQLQLGLAAKGCGDLELAEQALRAAAAARPDEGYPAAELALLLAETGRWPEAETLMNALTADLPDAARLARPCMGLFGACAGSVAPLTGDIEGADEPDPELLRQIAHWLDLMLRMSTLAAIGEPARMAKAMQRLSGAVPLLRKVPAPPDSEFARAVQALIDSPALAGRTVKPGAHGC
jgi:tetratricopeptide (TPR) repeat protein